MSIAPLCYQLSILAFSFLDVLVLGIDVTKLLCGYFIMAHLTPLAGLREAMEGSERRPDGSVGMALVLPALTDCRWWFESLLVHSGVSSATRQKATGADQKKRQWKDRRTGACPSKFLPQRTRDLWCLNRVPSLYHHGHPCMTLFKCLNMVAACIAEQLVHTSSFRRSQDHQSLSQHFQFLRPRWRLMLRQIHCQALRLPLRRDRPATGSVFVGPSFAGI